MEFTVYAVPVAQPRQRHRIIETSTQKFVHNYTPATDPVNEYKYLVRETARSFMIGKPLMRGPISLTAVFYLPRPEKLNTKRYPPGMIRHIGRKDIDNLYKSLTDAMIGVVYVDDCQICSVSLGKFYHEKDQQPRVHVSIYELEEQ